MKKLQKSKGFTLTELAIVIAVIAVLIAVLVPTFVSLINKANNSSDEQTVTNLNTALSIDEAENGKPESLCAVWDILEDAGYNAKPTPNYSDNEFYWYKAENRVVIVSDSVVTFPSEYAGINITDATADTGKSLCGTAVAAAGSASGVTFAKMDASIDEKEAHNDYFAESGHCTYCDVVSSVYMVESKIITLSDDGTTLSNVNTTAADFIIPDGITVIGASAFAGTESSPNTILVSVTIPETVAEIKGLAFAYCTSLESVTIPSRVTKIGLKAFMFCSSLTDLTIENGVSVIEGFAFYKCTSLESVTIPASVTTTDDNYGVFARCTSLKHVTIENGVTTIGKTWFYECTALKEITIPSSVTQIGAYAFGGCTALTAVNMDTSTWYYSTDGWAYASTSCSWTQDTAASDLANELRSQTKTSSNGKYYTKVSGSSAGGGSIGGNDIYFPDESSGTLLYDD